MRSSVSSLDPAGSTNDCNVSDCEHKPRPCAEEVGARRASNLLAPNGALEVMQRLGRVEKRACQKAKTIGGSGLLGAFESMEQSQMRVASTALSAVVASAIFAVAPAGTSHGHQ